MPGNGHNSLRWNRPELLRIERVPDLEHVRLLLSSGQPLHLQQHNCQLHLHRLWGQGAALLRRLLREQWEFLQVAIRVPHDLLWRDLRLHLFEHYLHLDNDRDGDVLVPHFSDSQLVPVTGSGAGTGCRIRIRIRRGHARSARVGGWPKGRPDGSYGNRPPAPGFAAVNPAAQTAVNFREAMLEHRTV